MEWFRRHLNWTAVFVAIGSWICGWFLVKFILFITGMVYIPLPGAVYAPSPPYSTGLNHADFTIQTIVDIAVILSTPVFFWILKRKRRSLWFLLLFMPPLLMSINPLASNLFVFVMPFWLAGWIVLVLLKSRPGLDT
jgi:hypothetical protein